MAVASHFCYKLAVFPKALNKNTYGIVKSADGETKRIHSRSAEKFDTHNI
jgi:hypothetical protein